MPESRAALTPPLTLAATRSARGDMHIQKLMSTFGIPGHQSARLFQFNGSADVGEVPLSWALSARAARDLDDDMPVTAPQSTGNAFKNWQEAQRLLEFLRGNL